MTSLLESMPQDCLLQCISQVGAEDKRQMTQISKELHEHSTDYVTKSLWMDRLKKNTEKTEKKGEVLSERFTCFKFINNRFPILTYQERFMGGTDYLDNIGPNELTHPIMVGKDSYNRTFVCVRYKCYDNAFEFDGNTHKLQSDKTYCITLFQRYTDSQDTWCKADQYSYGSPVFYGTGVSIGDVEMKRFIKNIFRMLNGMSYEYLDYESKQAQTPTVVKYSDCRLV